LPVPLLAVTPLAASSQSIQVNFATPLVLSTSATPGSWYADRIAPGAFASQQIATDGKRNTLEESIYTSGFQTPTPSFYDTQGRDYDLVDNTYSVSIELYVPASWGTENARMAGFWTTAVDATSVIGDYPIIEFQGPTTSDLGGPGYYPNGGVAGFYGFNNATASFDYIGLPPDFHYDSWVRLNITLIPGVGFQYSVTDPMSRHGVSISSPLVNSTDAALGAVLLQGYNYDQNYNIFWNDLTMTSSSLACSVKFKRPFGHDRDHR
jgi:hypothetical protein